MRLSQSFMPTFKEMPKDATIASHILMLRASLISKHGSGIYSYLPLGARVMNKLKRLLNDAIVKETQGQELVTPHLLLADLWQQTGRIQKMGANLFKFKDRHQGNYVLGPTHEETMVDLLKGNVKSYKQLPLNLFQIEKKFRDEIRPRYGVMRGREFTMLDGYSFHSDLESLDAMYQKYKKAYLSFFSQIGLVVETVIADSGDMGGAISEEFMVRNIIGDDIILKCDGCGVIANQEKSQARYALVQDEPSTGLKEVLTPNQKTMAEIQASLNLPLFRMIKTLVFKTLSGQIVMVCVRGDKEINEAKLAALLGEGFLKAPDSDVIDAIGEIGFLGPLKNIKNPEKVKLLIDKSLENRSNLVSGSNKKDVHVLGVGFEDFTELYTIEDLSVAQDGDTCGICNKGVLHSSRGIEVGHIFQLGDFYTRSMQFSVVSESGSNIYPFMGCYGLGVDRTLAAVIEQHYDDAGIIFPYSICPYQVTILVLDVDLLEESLVLYENLIKEGYEVMLDDRTLNIGVKFKDADLIGIPIRLAMGKHYKAEKKVGFKVRSEPEEHLIDYSNVLPMLEKAVEKLTTVH